MPTLLVVLALAAALLALTLWVGTRTSRGPGINRWNAGLALIALGWTLMLLRGALSDMVTVSAANAVLLAGVCVQIGAMLELGANAVPVWSWAAPPPVLFILLWMAKDNLQLVTVFTAAAYAPAFIVSAWLAVRLPFAARSILAVSFLLGAAEVLARALAIWLVPGPHPNLFSAGETDAPVFLLLFVLSLVNPFAFLIMQRERTETELRHAAMFDGLTEIFNRRAFIELAERELSRMRRSGEAFSMLMMDLDDFKRVNDRYGHQAGDRVLVDFAARAKACIRTADTLGRYGGEEFCALLPGASMRDATAVAQRIRACAQQPPLGGIALPVTVSIGVASWLSPQQLRLDDVIAGADEALYRAKAAGKNCVVAGESTSCGSAQEAPAYR
jgi:diguanylate cyclase (GGDEF)-like protein